MKSVEEILKTLEAFENVYQNCTNRNKSESVFWEQQEDFKRSEIFKARADIYSLVTKDISSIIKWIEED